MTGQNGILTQANDAKDQTQQASALEKVQIAIAGSFGNNGKINTSSLNDDLKNIEGLTTTLPITLPATVTVDGYDITIKNDGSVIKGDLIGEAVNADKYGWKVTNYKATTDEFTTGVWRLFYQNSNYTYLITDECVGSYVPSNYYSSYTDGSFVSTIGQKLNLMLLEIGTCFVDTNTNANIMATAWLTDTSGTGMWKDYKNYDAIFAIGSSTAELFAASFNATASTNGAKEITLYLDQYGFWRQTGYKEFKADYNKRNLL